MHFRTILLISLIILAHLKDTLFSSKNGSVCTYTKANIICSPYEHAIFGVLFQKSIYLYEEEEKKEGNVNDDDSLPARWSSFVCGSV